MLVQQALLLTELSLQPPSGKLTLTHLLGSLDSVFYLPMWAERVFEGEDFIWHVPRYPAASRTVLPTPKTW